MSRLPLGTLLSALALAGLTAACAAPENGGDDTMASDDASAATAAETSACWLRGGTTVAEAQERPSPLGQVSVTVGGESATFCYGRPSANDREVMGGLVPFGSIWRLGANETTQLHLPFAATVGGVEVEAGSYSLYAIPGEEEWEFFLNTNVERWGIPVDATVRETEVGSFTRPTAATGEMVETFTATWESHGEMMGHLVLEWENTRVEIPVHHGDMGEA